MLKYGRVHASSDRSVTPWLSCHLRLSLIAKPTWGRILTHIPDPNWFIKRSITILGCLGLAILTVDCSMIFTHQTLDQYQLQILHILVTGIEIFRGLRYLYRYLQHGMVSRNWTYLPPRCRWHRNQSSNLVFMIGIDKVIHLERSLHHRDRVQHDLHRVRAAGLGSFEPE